MQLVGDRGVGTAFRHESKHLSFSCGEGVEGVGTTGGPDELRHDLRIEDGATSGDPVERREELSDVGDSLLQQIPDSFGAIGEQVCGIPRLDVLGEHQDAESRVAATQLDCRARV